LSLRRYVPQPYLGNAILFRAKDELAQYVNPNLGWDKFVLGRLQVREVSGDHDTLMQEPHIGMLARMLASILETSDDTAVENSRVA
jgi:thioesterase domain-containing protein